jgi:hypothetical protein
MERGFLSQEVMPTFVQGEELPIIENWEQALKLALLARRLDGSFFFFQAKRCSSTCFLVLSHPSIGLCSKSDIRAIHVWQRFTRVYFFLMCACCKSAQTRETEKPSLTTFGVFTPHYFFLFKSKK